uniref:Immunoglobulin domain-containing protein n=1 Tax=Salmo trutta TaxID=8032 RepID=A0A674DDK4_SALTR
MISANQTTTKAGRFSVSDNTGEKSYTVTISDLTEDDTGTYWCGVVTSYISLITQVQLHVTDWRDVKQINVTGQVGETARFTCKYPDDNKSNEKFFCKGDSPLICEDKLRTTLQNEVVYEGRFSLRDNPRISVFTVYIKELRPEDSGTYWCGSDRRWRPADYTRCILSVGQWINSLHQWWLVGGDIGGRAHCEGWTGTEVRYSSIHSIPAIRMSRSSYFSTSALLCFPCCTPAVTMELHCSYVVRQCK